MKLFAAPLQGYTDAAWRHFHAEIYGGVDSYFTPFLRVEKGEMMRQDVKRISSPLNGNHNPVPQIIFGTEAEFDILVDTLRDNGFRAIDLNMGCPFPPQVKHGRGCGVLANKDLIEHISAKVKQRSDISFSIKMRLGIDSPEQWREVIGIINDMPLSHVTLHPRTAKEQYSGALHIEQFERFLSECHHPVVINGDISSIEQIADIQAQYPTLYGIMIGRGLLSRPSLAIEYRSGEVWSDDRQKDAVLRFHQELYRHYSTTLCGDTQILSHLRPFWEYLEPLIGHRTGKEIRKATSLSKYNAAVRNI